MVLSDPDMIKAAMVNGGALITGITLAGATVIDNEALITGLSRHIRRIVFFNDDDDPRVITLATGKASGAVGSTALKKYTLTINYGYFVWEPPKINEDVLKFDYALDNERLYAYLNAVTTGVYADVEYYDDLN